MVLIEIFELVGQFDRSRVDDDLSVLLLVIDFDWIEKGIVLEALGTVSPSEYFRLVVKLAWYDCEVITPSVERALLVRSLGLEDSLDLSVRARSVSVTRTHWAQQKIGGGVHHPQNIVSTFSHFLLLFKRGIEYGKLLRAYLVYFCLHLQLFLRHVRTEVSEAIF